MVVTVRVEDLQWLLNLVLEHSRDNVQSKDDQHLWLCYVPVPCDGKADA